MALYKAKKDLNYAGIDYKENDRVEIEIEHAATLVENGFIEAISEGTEGAAQENAAE